MRSIRDFGVLPENSPDLNKAKLQEAIDWASPRGAALYVEPDDEPYRLAGGVVLRANASLVGAHGPVGRGTTHATKAQPVGSVIATEDETRPLLIVEQATTPGAPNEIDLLLASLAAGEYMIELTATTSAGEAKDRIAFRVTS